MGCECLKWAIDYGPLVLLEHHRNCPKYNPQDEIAKLEKLVIELRPKKRTVKKKTTEGVDTQEFLATYCEAFKARWKTNPLIGGKEAGFAKQIVKNYGMERAALLVQVFLQMNDPWFLKRRHALDVFVSNIQSVVIAMGTGQTLTNREISQVDNKDYKRALLRKIEEGGI